MHSCPRVTEETALESGPTFSKFRARSGKSPLPPFSSLPFYLAQGKPSDLPALLPREGWVVSGTAWGLGGLVPHILFDLHNTVPARPSIPFPSLYLGNEWGRGALLSRRIGQEGATQRTPG